MNPQYISELTENNKVMLNKIEEIKHDNQLIKSGQIRNALKLKQAKDSGEAIEVAIEYERMTSEINHLKAKLIKGEKKSAQIANSVEIMNKRWEDIAPQEAELSKPIPKEPPKESDALKEQMFEAKREHQK